MTYPDTTENIVQNIILEKIKFQVNQELDKHNLFFDLKIDNHLHFLTGSMIYQLKAEIFGEKKKFPINVPKNWFQMFKKECYPAWLLKKYPVQYKDLGILELYQLYPHIKASIPNERHYIHFAKFEMLK